MPEIKVTDVDDNVSSDDALPEGLEDCALDFATAILSGSWRTVTDDEGNTRVATVEEMIAFRDRFANYFQAATTLRVKLDAQIWAGHDDGTVSETVESVRARRQDNGNKPGRKPAVKSLADQLLKR